MMMQCLLYVLLYLKFAFLGRFHEMFYVRTFMEVLLAEFLYSQPGPSLDMLLVAAYSGLITTRFRSLESRACLISVSQMTLYNIPDKLMSSLYSDAIYWNELQFYN